MPVGELFGTTIGVLSKSLDLRAKRLALISSNLANVDTPGYKPTNLSFEGELQKAIGQQGSAAPSVTHARHIPLKRSVGSIALVQGQVQEVSGRDPGMDGNGVELETEMGNLAENQILYNAAVQLLGKKFDGMKQAIKGTL